MDWKVSSKENLNALLTVAHPDDEVIFCGGTMLYYPDWKWQIVCMTEGDGNASYEEFKKAMDFFKKLGVNVDSYKWSGQRKLNNKASEEEKSTLQSEWKRALQEYKFSPDIVFTHNEKGEYGHEDHKLLNKVTRSLFLNIWEFICPGASNCSQPYKSKINVVPLSKIILDNKTKVFNHCYTSQLYVWKNLNDLMLYEFKTGPEIFTSD